MECHLAPRDRFIARFGACSWACSWARVWAAFFVFATGRVPAARMRQGLGRVGTPACARARSPYVRGAHGRTDLVRRVRTGRCRMGDRSPKAKAKAKKQEQRAK